MIRKALLTTTILLLVYSVFIYVFRQQIQRTGLTVEQNNLVKAEEFLYENGQLADTIIVGSSMSNRLLVDSLPGHYYNLSMEGLASVDGIALIAQTSRRPHLLLVETNSLDRLPDTAFFASLRQPVWAKIREYIPLTRLKYQPMGVVKALLRDLKQSQIGSLPELIDTSFASKLIQERLIDMNRIPTNNELRRKIAITANYIRSLQETGTQVVFFEMPTDPRIQNAKLSSIIRQLTRSTFPETAYQYIQVPSEFYQTTDGVHLPRFECIRYSHYLYSQLLHTRLPISQR
ncbi:hypothetical protein GCM10028805_64090 [Spirosoma harenae]